MLNYHFRIVRSNSIRKIFAVCAIPIFFILSIVFTTTDTVHAQNQKHWSLYGSDKNYLYFYDSSSVTKATKNYFTCWIKTIPKPENLEQIRQTMMRLNNPMSSHEKADKFNTKGYEKFVFILQTVRIDCKKQRVMYLSSIDYDEDGMVLKEQTLQQTIWQKIVPGSVGGSLMEKVCR